MAKQLTVRLITGGIAFVSYPESFDTYTHGFRAVLGGKTEGWLETTDHGWVNVRHIVEVLPETHVPAAGSQAD